MGVMDVARVLNVCTAALGESGSQPWAPIPGAEAELEVTPDAPVFSTPTEPLTPVSRTDLGSAGHCGLCAISLHREKARWCNPTISHPAHSAPCGHKADFPGTLSHGPTSRVFQAVPAHSVGHEEQVDEAALMFLSHTLRTPVPFFSSSAPVLGRRVPWTIPRPQAHASSTCMLLLELSSGYLSSFAPICGVHTVCPHSAHRGEGSHVTLWGQLSQPCGGSRVWPETPYHTRLGFLSAVTHLPEDSAVKEGEPKVEAGPWASPGPVGGFLLMAWHGQV